MSKYNPEKKRAYYAEHHSDILPKRRAHNKVLRDRQVLAAGRAPGTSCEICGRTFSDIPQWDHNHATGAFRGWLCGSCNRGLGLLGDSPDTVRAALHYLLSRGGAGPNTST